MKNASEYLIGICGERPIGSQANDRVISFLQKEALEVGCDVISLPLNCKRWEKGRCFIEAGSISHELYPSPFSCSFRGYGEVLAINSLEQLKNTDLQGKIALLEGEAAKEPMQPKDFPFFYPQEHKKIIDLLEEKRPAAIIAATRKPPMGGQEPFPMFEDGNFCIPSAYVNEATANKILELQGEAYLCIDSERVSAKSRQIIAVKKAVGKAKGKIIVCAHIDTKYDTPGTLDNAAGVAVLYKLMESLQGYKGTYDIEFVPFNGEEYYEAKGELEYLRYIESEFDSIKLVINIDSPGHKGSKNAVSYYNFGEELLARLNNEILNYSNIVLGEEWYSGDHSVFAFKGIPCMAVTSSDLFQGAIDITHTEEDTLEQVDCELLDQAADLLKGFIGTVAG